MRGMGFDTPHNKPMQLAALSFQKEGHCIVKLARIIKRSTLHSWRVVTPQLMGRAVRQHGFRIHTAVRQLAVDRRFARRPTEPPDGLLRNERARPQEQTCLSPISTN